MINIEKYNLSLLMLLPLINTETLTIEELIGEDINSLINGFSGDINRPWLDDHVILSFNPETMMSSKVKGLESVAENRFSKIVMINGKSTLIYALEIDEKYKLDESLIKENRVQEIKDATKIRIMSFWKQNNHSNLYKILFSKNYGNNSISQELLPEEDYIPQDYVMISGQYFV